MPRRAPGRPGSPGTPARPTRRASPSAPPARATPCARAAAAAATKCSTGPCSRPARSARCGAASRWKPRPGASTATPNARAQATGADHPDAAAFADRPGRARARRALARSAAQRACRACARHAARQRARASCRWPGRCSSARSRCWLSHHRHRAGGALLGDRPGGAGGGRAAYITVFIGLMGVVLAVGPIVGQLFGAKRYAGRGRPGAPGGVAGARRCRCWAARCWCFPEPFLALAQAAPEVAGKVRGYLLALAFCAAGVAAVHRLPRLQHRGVAAQGGDGAAARRAGAEGAAVGAAGVRRAGARLPALGVVGCGIATAHRDVVPGAARPGGCCGATRSTRRSRCSAAACDRPNRAALRAQLQLGVPMGAGDPDRGHRLRLHGVLHLAPRRHAGGRAPDRGQPGVAAVHDAAGAGQCHQHAGGAEHRRRRRRTTRGAWAGTACSSAALLALVLGGAVFFAREADRAPVHRRRRRSSPPRCRCWPGWRCSTSPTRCRPWPPSCCAPTASPPCRW